MEHVFQILLPALMAGKTPLNTFFWLSIKSR